MLRESHENLYTQLFVFFDSQNLLEGRLRYEGSVHGYSGQLLDQTRTLMAGCDFISLQLLRLRALAPVRYLPYVVCVCVSKDAHVCMHIVHVGNIF